MKHLVFIAAALVAACVMAEPEKAGPMRGGNRPMPMHGPMMQQSGMWVTRMLSSKNGLERLGIEDSELRDKIIAAITPIKEEGDNLEQKIRAIAREQAELTRGLFEDKTRDPKPVMEKIGEIARLRAKQGKLSVRAMLVLRDNLSPEQLEKAKKMIFDRGRERMFHHGQRGEGAEGMRRGPGPRGEGRRPGFKRDGEQENDRPAKECKKAKKCAKKEAATKE